MPSSNASISFEVKSTITNETIYSNNTLSIGTHDLTIGYWVEKPLYDALNNAQNMRGSYSFEDWIQEHIFALNTRLSGSKYYGGQFPPSFPSANGIPIQIRLDYIIVGEQFDGLANPFYISANYGENYYNTDGHWKTTDGYETNELYPQGFAQWYTDTYAKNLDIGLLHEIAHQLGAPDLYQTDLNYIYTDGNNGLQIKNILGEIITRFSLPGDGIMYPYAGLMAGGDARPYDSTYFSSHTATGMATTAGYRRGFYAEYLFDTPKITNIKIVDGQNQPLANKKIALYQKSYDPTSIFDNIPEIIGTTDALGNFQLPNRTTSTVTTITGHTLSNNPFGQIDVVARNATMIVAITNQEQTEQGFGILTLLDLNLEYWKGNKEIANITIKTNYPKIINNTPTQVPTPTMTPTRVPTFTPTPTRIPTSTPTPTRTPTSTPTPTRVLTSTPTPTRTPTFTPTPTRIPTTTPTPTQIPQSNKNLLLNYGFESLDINRYPTNWSPVRISSDKITYITGFTGNNAVKLTAYLGNWTGYTQRVIGPWTKGAQITFGGYAYSQEISTLNQNGDIQVIIYYANSQVQDLTLVPTTSKKWEYLEKRFTITQDAKSLMYRIRSPISASNNISFDELKLSIN